MNDDQRPKPQYGEYATPQEQAKAMGLTTPPSSHYPPPLNASPTNAPSQSVPLANVTPTPYGVPTARKTSAAPRRWDLVLSVGLLAYGLLNIIAGFVQFSDLGQLINEIYAAQGIGKFTPTSLSSSLGIVVNLANVVLWISALLITVRLLRRGKLAFYVPLIGGALASIVAAVCMVVLLLSDPAFAAYVSSHTK